MFIKNGELIEISRIEDTASCIPSVSPEILENFKKFAANLKKIAPKAEDFLYFSAVMMHAAEAAALNDDGTLKITASGDSIKVGWDKSDNTWRWETNDSSIKPYKNSNGDIFPEEELVKAYKKWIGKPLCIDHKSSSVDHVRGFIVDTYYDRNLKRVIALCALDKHNYPDLARKVATGYSNSVSMGTAVGRAICTEEGCHRVARTEADFCTHMKNKTCYGEINVDLNPIELSIVVNGADPKAHIKHIIAAANTLNTYVEFKEKELNKVADNFSASLQVNKESGETSSINLQSTTLEGLKKDIDNAMEQLGNLTQSLKNTEKDTNDLAFNQSSGTVAMDETVTPNTDSGLATPVRYASTNVEADLVSELRVVTASIEAKLSQMKTSLDKLANTSTSIQEENMSGSNINKQGYFQGAGNENEPSPGKPKYPKEPMNEKLRTDGDKHMDVDDMGSPEQLYPGDLERKKMLARAEAEERAMRRNAVVNLAKQALETKKEAYFQAGDKNPQEPTPGKTKYPPEKLNEQLRDHSDKHMTGQKPFPGVGPVDGMHPSPASADTSDEGKRKDMMQRASLRARFVKASNDDGTQNHGKSGWEVFLGDKLLLTASVDELSGNRANTLYNDIATKAFGAKLIENIKTFGADKVRTLVKGAQAAPPAPPAPAPEAGPTDAAPEGEPAEDTGKSGDPKETALELAEKVRDLSSDLVEAVRALTGEQNEMGGEEGVPNMGAAASETHTLNTLRKELNGALTNAMKESVAELQDHQQELMMIVGMYDKGAVTASNKEFVGSIIEDALVEAKTAVADGFKLMTAFVKYARGTEAIVKRAEIEAELESLATEGDTAMSVTDTDIDSADDLNALITDTDNALNEVNDMIEDVDSGDGPEDEPGSIEDLLEGIGEFGESDEPDESSVASLFNADDNDAINTDNAEKALEIVKKDPNAEVQLASFNSLEGRSALRAKLAADAMKTSPHLHEAHPKGNATTDLDVKPSNNLGVVENLEETHKAMLDLANAPPKVRKEAEAIHRLVSEGKLDPADLDALIAEGLDKDAVAYYKKYWAQVDGGSEFASELIKEHVKAEMEAELNKYRVKMARAYELAYDMVDRGLCHNDRQAVSSQVDEIMKFNDDSFDSLKRVVAKHTPVLRKEAGHIPQVGMIGSGEFAPASSNDDNLVAQLSAALSKTSKGSF